MLSISKMTESARKALGWPYVSPGSNNSSGIDCSGLFVYMYREQGAKIAHGSNSIFHKYLSDSGRLTSTSQLQVGMAVFKLKEWTPSDSSNQWYGREPGNLSHIGYVASVNPLEIIHASSVSGCVTIDNSIKKWAYWGRLKDVDYSGQPSPEPGPAPEPTPVEPEYATVWADSGSTVFLRKEKSTSSRYLVRVPIGDKVRVIRRGDTWCNVAYTDSYPATWQGYMMTKFLRFDDPSPTPEPAPEPAKGITVIIPGLNEEEADALLTHYPQGFKTYG